MSKYEVIAGNIGRVYDGADEMEARRLYDEYVALSESGLGRAGGESVTLWDDDEPIDEFVGARERGMMEHWFVQEALNDIDVFPPRFIVDAVLLRESYEHAMQYGEPVLAWSCDDVPTLIYAILTGDGDTVPALWVPVGEE